MTEYYCDDKGRYAGAFDGDHGLNLRHLIEVPVAPEHGLDIWNVADGVWERDPVELARAVKRECGEIIVSRVHEKDQRNLTALALRHLKRERGGGGRPRGPRPEVDAQLNVIDDIFDWIQAMKEESRRAIRDGDKPAWPVWNDDWSPLIRLV